MSLRLVGRVVSGAAAIAILCTPAHASQLIARDAVDVALQTNGRGEALVTYKVGGRLVHLIAWGAVNAAPPTRSHPQVAFKLDYAGGFDKYRNPTYWANFRGSCLPYDGPLLAWKVAACKAPDGSYWALQSWQRELPDYGVAPTRAQSAWELRLSHWTGTLPQLTISTDWAYHRYDQLFGSYTYGGLSVFGFRSTSSGQPLDSYGRNIYVDTFDSLYGPGWRRENSFLAHRPRGTFCYGFYPHGARPPGIGTEYRATAEGPGVAPDVSWVGSAPGPFDEPADQSANRRLAMLHDPICRPN
jgi:hypothetical protein